LANQPIAAGFEWTSIAKIYQIQIDKALYLQLSAKML